MLLLNMETATDPENLFLFPMLGKSGKHAEDKLAYAHHKKLKAIAIFSMDTGMIMTRKRSKGVL